MVLCNGHALVFAYQMAVWSFIRLRSVLWGWFAQLLFFMFALVEDLLEVRDASVYRSLFFYRSWCFLLLFVTVTPFFRRSNCTAAIAVTQTCRQGALHLLLGLGKAKGWMQLVSFTLLLGRACSTSSISTLTMVIRLVSLVGSKVLIAPLINLSFRGLGVEIIMLGTLLLLGHFKLSATIVVISYLKQIFGRGRKAGTLVVWGQVHHSSAVGRCLLSTLHGESFFRRALNELQVLHLLT